MDEGTHESIVRDALSRLMQILDKEVPTRLITFRGLLTPLQAQAEKVAREASGTPSPDDLEAAIKAARTKVEAALHEWLDAQADYIRAASN